MLSLLGRSALCILLAVVSSTHVHAAHSRARPRAVPQRENDFDRTTASFTNEGRLLQIEYGMEATQRASTAAVINLRQDEEGDDTAIICVVKKWDKVFQLDDHVFLVVTGLAGDATFMARYLRQFCQDFRKTYGEAPTIKEVAQRAASAQHSLTVQDTYRPLGITGMVVGLDPHSSRQRVYRTDPGGTIDEMRYSVGGKNQVQASKDIEKVFEKFGSKDKSKLLSELLKSTIHLVGGEENVVDVWTLQADPKNPGKLQTKCYLNVGTHWNEIAKRLSDTK